MTAGHHVRALGMGQQALESFCEGLYLKHFVLTSPDDQGRHLRLCQRGFQPNEPRLGAGVLTVYPGGTDTPMMKTNRAGPELGFGREPASAVADATVDGIEAEAFEVIRGGDARAQMITLNRDNPAAIDERMLSMKPARGCREGSLGPVKASPTQQGEPRIA